MGELITILKENLGNETVNSINARDLHEFLDSKREFATWIKNRLDEVEAVENVDFISFDKNVKRETGATIRKEYIITLDLAKEFAMLERNEKGKQARKYFIDVEKKYKTKFAVPTSFKDALLLAAKQAEEIEKLEAEHKANLPKIAFASAVEASATSALIGDFVKTLCDNDIRVGRNRVFKWLRDEKYLMSDNMPYQKWLDAGYFEVIPQIIVTIHGNKEKFTTKITAKGQVGLTTRIVEKFKKVA